MRDVVIIGAGPAGLSLAAGLARQGWDALLVEKGRLPRHKVCGEFLSPDALASLRALGLYERVAALGPQPIGHALLVSRTGLSLRLSLPGEGWGLSRHALDLALLNAAREAGAEVRTGVAASRIAQDGDHFRVAVNGDWVRCRAVIGTWGRQAAPPLRAHPPPPPDRSWVGVKRHYQGVPPNGGAVELYFAAGGYVGLAPVEGGRYNCSALFHRAAFQAAGGTADGCLAQACRQNPALAARLAGSRQVPGSAVAAAGIDTGRRPVPWTSWPLLGDAAAVIPPVAGDGVAMALRSAVLTLPLAAAHLAGRLSRQDWAAHYARACRSEFARRIALARQVQAWLTRPLLGDGLILLGHLLPWAARRMVIATRGSVHTG